jgi:hypothetical protein
MKEPEKLDVKEKGERKLYKDRIPKRKQFLAVKMSSSDEDCHRENDTRNALF